MVIRMAVNHTVILAGFGGQGILFAGKVMAYAGLTDGMEVSWLPSYGPEMRGGTANCSVTISDEPIGSPLITNPNRLLVMNLPSFDKFIGTVEPGGTVVVDSSLIDKKTERNDLNVYYIPATRLAVDSGLKGLANMIMLGKLLKETKIASMDSILKGLDKSVPPKKKALIEPNKKAISLGMEY